VDVNLVLVKRNGSRKNFPLPSSVTVIGRRRNCDLWVPLASVSRKHCQLSRNDGVLKIRDLGSRNGTFLNGKRVDEAVVKAGDSIKIGPLAFVFQIDGQPETVVQAGSAAGSLPRQEAAAGDVAAEDEQFDDLAEFDDLDSLDELDSLEEAGSA
jgi:pSer/pThr/pTyr-binding forkhead associated (FHA) protein